MILVLGGSSFSGSSYVSHLLSMGEKVVSFERTELNRRLFSPINPSVINNYTRISFNLNSSPVISIIADVVSLNVMYFVIF